MAKTTKSQKKETSVDKYVGALANFGKTGAEPLKVVMMIRDDGKKAKVHPAEVDNYKKGGYVLAGNE